MQGADVSGLSGAELVHIVGISEQRTAERYDIANAGLHGFNGHIRIVHPSGAEHRHVHDLLYRLGVLAVQALFLIHGRVAPPPGVVGADVHVKRVITVGHERFAASRPSSVSRPFSTNSSPGSAPSRQSLIMLFGEKRSATGKSAPQVFLISSTISRASASRFSRLRRIHPCGD